MSLFRGRYRVESTRWPERDYGAPGYYFVTICTKGPFFGDIFRDGTMWLSPTGAHAARCWAAIPRHFPCVLPDAFVVMPDHVHGIVAIAATATPTASANPATAANPTASASPTTAANPTVETQHAASLRRRQGIAPPLRPGSLPVIVRGFKSAVTRWARRNGHDGFAWQARYHDRVIRSERELAHVRRYIAENPRR